MGSCEKGFTGVVSLVPGGYVRTDPCVEDCMAPALRQPNEAGLKDRRRQPQPHRCHAGFYPDITDTSVKPHHGAGGVSCNSEGSTAKSSSVRRLD